MRSVHALSRGLFYKTFVSTHVFSDYECENRLKYWILLMCNMPRLNNDNRNRILGLLQGGLTQTVVARRFNVNRSTISRLVQRNNATGSVSDRPRPGAMRATTRRQDVYIRQRHLRNRFLTASSTAHLVVGTRGRPIHRTTVTKRLRDYGIRCRRPVKVPVLNAQHRRARLQWARNNAQRPNWNSVVFSDESRFNLFNADGRIRIYRRRNERFADICVKEHERYGGGGVMVWGAINCDFKSELIICHGNLNANQYIAQILTPSVLPMFHARNGLTFQQDNAPPHRARVTMNFLNAHGIPVLAWPSLSPDLNPIEHMWDELGRRIRRRPNAANNVQELTAALVEEWNRIPRQVYRTLCRSMRSRIQEVITKHGGHTRY